MERLLALVFLSLPLPGAAEDSPARKRCARRRWKHHCADLIQTGRGTFASAGALARAAVLLAAALALAGGAAFGQILELPSNLRSVYNNAGDSGLIANLMPLAVPGVVQMGSGAYWMVPGSGPNGLRLKVDGIHTNFGNFSSPDPVSQPSMESIEEFTANLTANRAEFSGLGAVTTVTKSGSNELHGSLFWYGKNAALDARNPFLPERGFQNIHDYGGSAGGPLVRDKMFFYATVELIDGVRGYTFTANVPTLAQRAGLFPAAVRNPYAGGQPFAGNQIPASLISPEARRAQELLYPLPNFGPESLAAGNYRAAFNGPESHRLLEGRLDRHFGSRQAAFLRYQHKRDDYDIPGARSPLPPVTAGTSKNLRKMHFVTVGHTWTLGPSIFNEFRSGLVQLESSSSANVKGQALLDQIGIRGLPPRPGAPGVPRFNVSGLSTFTQILLNPVVDRSPHQGVRTSHRQGGPGGHPVVRQPARDLESGPVWRFFLHQPIHRPAVR
jgi:hypothetical protein